MASIYYDNDWRGKILKQEKTQLYRALAELGRYCEKFPKDKMTIQSYIRMLTKVGRLEEAEQQIKKLEELIEESRRDDKEPKKNIDKDEDSLRLYQFILFGWQQRYEEAMKHYKEHSESIERNGFDVELMTLYCKCKLGRLPELAEREDFDYRYKAMQIIEYKESELFEQIRNFYISESGYQPPKNRGKSYFNSDFPYEGENSIYPVIKQTVRDAIKLPNQDAKRINQKFPIVSYIFKYPGCGMSEEQLVDFFIVEVIAGTDNIVKMYPSVDCQNLPYYDLTTLVPSNKPNTLTKGTDSRNRIDRFNQRFGLK